MKITFTFQFILNLFSIFMKIKVKRYLENLNFIIFFVTLICGKYGKTVPVWLALQKINRKLLYELIFF